MIDEIDLEKAGEHMGIIFPSATGVRYRMRVEIDMPRFLTLRGFYVPLGNCQIAPMFDYLRKDGLRTELLPPMPDTISSYHTPAEDCVTKWLHALDLDGLLRPATRLEYGCTLVTGGLHGQREPVACNVPYCEQWVPVTVRDAVSADNCAFPGWTNTLCDLSGETGVLVHDTW